MLKEAPQQQGKNSLDRVGNLFNRFCAQELTRYIECYIGFGGTENPLRQKSDPCWVGIPTKADLKTCNAQRSRSHNTHSQQDDDIHMFRIESSCAGHSGHRLRKILYDYYLAQG